MIRKLSAGLGQIHPGAFYLASAVALSLAVNTFTSAYGTVPAPANQIELLLCTVSAFVSAIALSMLAWKVETIRSLAMERSAEAGIPARALISEAAATFSVEVMLMLSLGIAAAVMSVVFILVGN